MILFMICGGIQISYAQNEICTKPDKAAFYPGGSMALVKFLKTNVKYPDAAKTAKVKGTVLISFIIEKSGGLTSLEILKGLGHGCDEEALRVVRKMPKWYPASVGGQPVRSVYKLYIKFPQP